MQTLINELEKILTCVAGHAHTLKTRKAIFEHCKKAREMAGTRRGIAMKERGLKRSQVAAIAKEIGFDERLAELATDAWIKVGGHMNAAWYGASDAYRTYTYKNGDQKIWAKTDAGTLVMTMAADGSISAEMDGDGDKDAAIAILVKKYREKQIGFESKWL